MQNGNKVFSGETMDRALQEGIWENGLPFAIGGLCGREGILYEGFSHNESLCGPVNMDTILWIASMSKAVTSVAVMQLVEQGMLSLEQEAGSILPELLKLQVLERYDEHGNAILTPCESAVTIRQLLNHTSGFAYSFWDRMMDRYYSENKLPDTTSGSLKCLSVPLVRQPGTVWEYGISTDWLGLILENLTGLRLGQYFEKYIFNPLQMYDTGFEIADMKRLAPFYHLSAGGGSPQERIKKLSFIFPQNAEFHSGGAGLYSTVRDYLHFSRMLLNGGNINGVKILRPETVAQMFANGIGELEVKPLEGCGDSLDLRLYDGIRKKWGLCFMINEEKLSSGRSPGSQFWGGAANTFVWIDHKKGIAGVYATQILPFLNESCENAFTAFETAAYRCCLDFPD